MAEQRSAVAEVSAMAYAEIKRRIEVDGSVRLPEVKHELIAQLLHDPEFVQRYLAETLAPVIYDASQRACARTRGNIVFGDEVVSLDEAKTSIRKTTPKWQSWLEHVGDRHVRLWDMRKDDLLAAAVEREQRGQAEYRLAALWREVAAQMKGRRTVGQVFTEERLAALAASLDVRVSVTLNVIEEREAA